MGNTPFSRVTRKKRTLRIARDKKADHIGPTPSLNDMTSLKPNQAAPPSGNCSKRFFEFRVESDEGLDLCVDLETTPSELAQYYSSLGHTGSDENPLVASKGKFRIVDILEDAQLKGPVRNEHAKEVATKEDIGCGDKSPVPRGAQLKTSIKNKKPMEVIVEEDIDCGDQSPARGGSQLTTPRRDEHEAPVRVGAPDEVSMEEEDVGCGDKLPDSRQVATNFRLLGLTPSSLASVHTAIILYNYFHRKMCPELAFADAKRFFMCASLSVGEDLLPYLSMVHERDSSSVKDVSLSVTDREAIQACEIAAELGASNGYPDVAVWPIGKVAVLLLDQTKKKCLIEYGADTKGVWSIIEKEYDAAAGISHSTNQPAGQESTNGTTSGTLDSPFTLEQLAMSEVQRRTGMEGSDLLFLDETLAYSLSKERTTTKLFIVEYKKTPKGKLVEISLEELITSMTGPVFLNDPFPKTTSVVEYYHILPYKDILEGLLHRKWPAVPLHGLHSVIDEKLEKQDENSTSRMQKQITKVSTPKQKKRAIKATGANSNQNSNISKHKKSNKRKAEASRATATEGPDGESLIKENGSLIAPDVKTLGLMTKSINTKATAAEASGGPILLQSGGQVDKNKTQKQSMCDNMPQNVSPTEAPYVDPVIKNSALEPHNMEETDHSGGVTENNNDQICDLLRSIQKIRDEILCKECILQERSIQCEMDFQTILKEGKMTPKVLSIVDKYKGSCSNMTEVANSSCSGDGGKTMSIKRMRLKEALLVRNKCRELDEICNLCKWILPRYTIVPSVADGMFYASVHLTCPDFDLRIAGDPSPTPREARFSAAANMIVELHKKAKEE